MDVRPLRLVFLDLCVLSTLILSGCASRSDTAQQAATYEEDFNDPLEDTNRKIFEFNQVVDRNVLVPVAKAYRTALPDPVRDSLRDFLNIDINWLRNHLRIQLHDDHLPGFHEGRLPEPPG